MSAARHKLYKPALVLGAAGLLALTGLWQHRLNALRRDPDLGLSRFTALDSAQAPPVLAFVTVALGSFRGLIANALWIRANDLQQEGKYFEMVQLADWITVLEPTFTQVWLVQAWNMAYNISVKFTDPADRWRWVQRGIELLRDKALRYCPKEPMIYRELAWLFQHKLGQDLDDAHRHYKTQWAREMTQLFGGPRPNFAELLNPATDDARRRVALLRTRYKMDPRLIQEVDAAYGPLEWRLPEAHAIYWASVGLTDAARTNLDFLRRAILQPSQMSVFRGRIVQLPETGNLVTGPDLSKVNLVNGLYERMIAEEELKKWSFQQAHWNYLQTAIYLLYTHNQIAEARFWYSYLHEHYPDRAPAGTTVDEWVLKRHIRDLPTLGYDKMVAVIEGYIVDAYVSTALDDPDRAAGMMGMALQMWQYARKKAAKQEQRLGLPPFEDMKRAVLDRLLAPDSRLTPGLKARLRTLLNLA
ncbi:MAG: hypothetical protein JXQ71_03040 [Verrucomicrobia bacterium]|nr:hypothetical protein [Verrucomicrobiota bacterium]